jgi:hypothetical protein
MDKKSHTGCVITLGKGAIYSKSSTQKLNTLSSTEAELVTVTEASYQVLWTKNFLSEQGNVMKPATMFQDNQSTIHLLKNGQSNSETTRHIDIRYFFITDRIKRGDIQVIYKPILEMMADIMTKPLTGNLFQKLETNCSTSHEHSLPSTTSSPYSMPNIFLLYPPPISLLPRLERSRHGLSRLPIDFHQLQSTTDTLTDRDTFFLWIFLCRDSLQTVHAHIHRSIPLLLTSSFYPRFSKTFLLPFPKKTFL